MSTDIFPMIFVPMIGLIFPFITLNWFFRFIDKEEII